MVDTANTHNPWQVPEGGFTFAAKDQGASHSPLQIETIENVEPLDQQFGINPKKSVPDALHVALFGQSEPTEAEIALAEGHSAVPPLQTYAVLDAAKAVNLPELLSASRLEHRCLFMGAAYDEMKNVAPWIVRLEDGNDFTRRLFTGPEGINGLWDKKPGIYMRSRATLDEMWRHLRKFTRVQDNGGNWHYFRFWEAWAFRSYMEHNRNICEQFSRWCIVRPCGVPVYFFTLTDDGVFTTFEAPEHLTYEPRNSRFSLNRLDIAVLCPGAASGFDQRLEEYLMREVPAFGELEGAMRRG